MSEHETDLSTIDVQALLSIAGKTALVTGAGTGLGQAIAVGLSAAGADLLLLSDRDNLAVTQKLVRGHGREAQPFFLDVAQAGRPGDDVTPLLAAAGVDILVNCAGIISRRPAEDISHQDWHTVMDVNLNGLFALTREIGRTMLERRRGKIINVASMLSFQGGVHAASYTASKHAVVGVTRALANEWASRNVQVNALAPGYYTTEVTAGIRADREREAAIVSRIPAGRWGRPSDLIGAAVLLASPASDYITGHVLAVDGGWLTR